MCPECTWALGFEGGEWTPDGEMCDWINFVWFGIDYLNYSAAEGAYDWTVGYSPTAPDRWDPDVMVYQQIWRYRDQEWTPPYTMGPHSQDIPGRDGAQNNVIGASSLPRYAFGSVFMVPIHAWVACSSS